jgi:uncharacterized membrane protein YfcA
VTYLPWLGAVTLLASVVSGGLGYGFSSLTVPVALLWLANRTLNPAMVIVEVVLNAYVLIVNAGAIPRVWKRVLPLVAGLVPGILAGAFVIARLDPAWLKLATFGVLAPLILMQAAGIRRPFASERLVGPIVGTGVGVLYAVTTISGPPLAVLLNNQGFTRDEFRAALGIVRLFESTFTAIVYTAAGMMALDGIALLPSIVPSVAAGVPAGVWLTRRIDGETFRRVAMSFDAWVVAFGLATLLRSLHIAGVGAANAAMAVVIAVDLVLLVRFARLRQRRATVS